MLLYVPSQRVNQRDHTMQIKRLSRQRGFSLFELALAAVIGATVLAVAAQRMAADGERATAAIAGQQMLEVGKAFNADLIKRSAVYLANPTTSATIGDLIGQSLLPANFSTTNNFGSTYTILVRRVGSAPDYNLEGMVIANQPIKDSREKVRTDLAGSAVDAIGADGGMSLDGATIKGIAGAWSVSNADYPAISSAAQIGIRVGSASSMYSQFLLLDGSRAMTGPLRPAQMVLGGACTTNGAIAQDAATNELITCQAGAWKQPETPSFWRDPVANYAALPAVGNTVGDTRVTIDTGRVFMWSGGTWKAAAADQNGDITLRNIDASGAITAVGSLSAGTLQPTSVITPNGACAQPSGTMAKDAAGKIYSCQAGAWKVATSGGGSKITNFIQENDGKTFNLYLIGNPNPGFPQIYTLKGQLAFCASCGTSGSVTVTWFPDAVGYAPAPLVLYPEAPTALVSFLTYDPILAQAAISAQLTSYSIYLTVGLGFMPTYSDCVPGSASYSLSATNDLLSPLPSGSNLYGQLLSYTGEVCTASG